jgi:endonuclease YncB( thermonuclease family)
MAAAFTRPLLVVLLAAAGWLAMPAASAHAASGPCLPKKGSPRCTFWTGKVVFVADGDTVDIDVDGDGRGARRVRMTGYNAMELTTYSHEASRRRGECHGVEAAARLQGLLRRGRQRVRLAAQDPRSRSGYRLRRQVSTRINGRWVDVGRVLVGEGHALWMSNPVEWAWNSTYRTLAQQAAVWGERLWNPHGCGDGPAPGAHFTIRVNYDAPGADADNVSGEWARISNRSGVDVPLAGWWFRDSALRRYRFPQWAVLGAYGSVTVRMGRGRNRDDVFHWGLPAPPFENPSYDRRGVGDGGYLFDPRGNLRASVIYP